MIDTSHKIFKNGGIEQTLDSLRVNNRVDQNAVYTAHFDTKPSWAKAKLLSTSEI